MSSLFAYPADVQAQLAGGVQHTYSISGAYAALTENGSVITWGH